MGTFQYQQRTSEGPYAHETPQSGPGDGLNQLDFYQQHPNPVLRPPGVVAQWFGSWNVFVPFSIIQSHSVNVHQHYIHAFYYQGKSAGPTERFEEQNTSTEWFVQPPDPVRRKKRAASDTWYAVDHPLDPENTSTEWYTQIPQPIRKAPDQPYYNDHFVAQPLDPENTSTEWYVQHPQPVLRIPYTASRTQYEVEPTPPGQTDVSIEWYVQHPIPVLRPVDVASLFFLGGDILRHRRRVKIPPLVQHEPDSTFRQQRHEQYVARIMNSLLLQGEIVQEAGAPAGGKWHLGVQPTTGTDWNDDQPPETINELADRIVAFLLLLADELGITEKP